MQLKPEGARASPHTTTITSKRRLYLAPIAFVTTFNTSSREHELTL